MRQSYAHAEEGHGNTLHRQRHADSCEVLTMDTRCGTAMEAARSRTGVAATSPHRHQLLATQPALVAVCVPYLVSYLFFFHSASKRGQLLRVRSASCQHGLVLGLLKPKFV